MHVQFGVVTPEKCKRLFLFLNYSLKKRKRNNPDFQGVLHSRCKQPARLLGQAQTGQQADDQVQDEEQQVGEPPAGTDRDRQGQKINLLLISVCPDTSMEGFIREKLVDD